MKDRRGAKAVGWKVRHVHVLASSFTVVWSSTAVNEDKEKQSEKIGIGKKGIGVEEIDQEMEEESAEAFLNGTQTHALLLAGSMLNVHMAPFV